MLTELDFITRIKWFDDSLLSVGLKALDDDLLYVHRASLVSIQFLTFIETSTDEKLIKVRNFQNWTKINCCQKEGRLTTLSRSSRARCCQPGFG